MGREHRDRSFDNHAEYHTPVLLKEALEFLAVKEGEKYIDATLGGGGHTAAILRAGGVVLGVDRDPEALAYAGERLAGEVSGGRLTLGRGNFREIDDLARASGFDSVAGVLYDLGTSSHQLTSRERGFSFGQVGKLDMRMDPDLAVTARDLVNGLGEKELMTLILKFGEDRLARRIARAIVRARKADPIETTDRLAEVVRGAYPPRSRYDRTHPATRTFQALRIAVNDELNNLKISLPRAVSVLREGGRLVVISFHSLEDRIVKDLSLRTGRLRLEVLTPRVVKPTAAEVAANPRARSGRLRAFLRR